MKILKFLFLVLVATVMALGQTYAKKSNSQKVMGEYSFTPGANAFFLECIDEAVTGKIYGEWTWWNKTKRLQEKWNGTFIGNDTGDIYSVKMVKNSNNPNYEEGKAFQKTFVWNISVVNETLGMEVGKIHMNTHFTINANGVPTSDVNNFTSECY